MITLTAEQAQQIEESLEANLTDDYLYYSQRVARKALATIRAARAQEQAEQPVSQEYQDHLVNQSFDWAAMAAKHQFMEGYRIGLAEMREKCAKVCDDMGNTEANMNKTWRNGCSDAAAAIRAINFEGDTGFRHVSEMIAEHKQDPKKAAAIEKAKMRKAEQEPVAFRFPRDTESWTGGWTIDHKVIRSVDAEIEDNEFKPCLESVEQVLLALEKVYAAPQPMKQEPECKYKEAYIIWQDKTEWVQETAHLKELGMHRADVLRQRIENLQNAATHPVRTKDLTDDEIDGIANNHDDFSGRIKVDHVFDFARAVIAADRMKNK